MKYTHHFRNVNSDPGLTTLVVTDSNSAPYVPAGYEVTAGGALTWDGRDVFVSDCAGCDATGDETPCAQRIYLRDLDEVVVHEVDVPPPSKPAV